MPRDFNYWRRQMGRPQERFREGFVELDRNERQRARNVPFLTREEFHRRYGDDADFGQWLHLRKYRPEDLNDPVVFETLVLQRKDRFEGEFYDSPYAGRQYNSYQGLMTRPLHTRADDALQEAAEELDAMDEGRKRSRWTWEEIQQEQAERAVSDLPVLTPGKKIRFEDME